MKRETLLTLAVAALLVLNLGIVAYLLMSRRPPELREQQGAEQQGAEQQGNAEQPERPEPQGERPPPKGKKFDMLVITQLRLSEAQQEQFNILKHEHRLAMEELDAQYREALKPYFTLLRDAKLNVARQDSLEQVLARIHRQKITITLQHFVSLKNICTTQQLPLFEKLIPELSHVLTQPQRKPREDAP